MNQSRRRKTLRIVLGILAIIPVALLAYKLIFLRTDYGGDSIQEMALLWFGVPILVLNYWAWADPEIIEILLWGDRKKQN